MPSFKYRAKENTGNTIEGVVVAGTSEEAIEQINQLGYLPVKIEEEKNPVAASKKEEPPSLPPPPAHQSFAGKIKSKEITVFGLQLASLIKSGVPILRALGIIASASRNPSLKRLLSQIQEEVRNGTPLSIALSSYPQWFPSLYLAMVQAGEYGGNLDKTLILISNYRQRQEEIFSRIRSAMAYPLLMMITGVGTIVFMLTFVIPRLMGIFSQMGESLPVPTRILIGISEGLRHGWFLGVGIVATLSLALWRGQKSKKQRLAASLFQLNLPVLGPLTLKAEIARFSRTLELLIRNGIPILKAIETSAPVVENEVLREEFIRCLKDLKEGGSFGKSLKQSNRFPVIVTNLIEIGEESGKLDEALSEIAGVYERETDEALRMATSLLEPLMILVMGLVVGFIVIAMLLPMFELNMAVK